MRTNDKGRRFMGWTIAFIAVLVLIAALTGCTSAPRAVSGDDTEATQYQPRREICRPVRPGFNPETGAVMAGEDCREVMTHGR